MIRGNWAYKGAAMKYGYELIKDTPKRQNEGSTNQYLMIKV